MLKYPNGFLYRYISYNSKFMEACEIYGGLLLLGLTSKKHQEYARNQHAPKKNMEHHSWIPFSFSFLCLSLSLYLFHVLAIFDSINIFPKCSCCMLELPAIRQSFEQMTKSLIHQKQISHFGIVTLG